MATEKQIAANRANAQKSCGPHTTEGKAKSSMNHLTWGFCSSGVLMPGEEPAEFCHLLDDLIDHYQPANVTEQILVEEMAKNKWLSDRAFRLQGESFVNNMVGGEKFAIPKELGLLIRYRTSSQNAFHKAHKELVKAQKERVKSEIGFESKEAAEGTAGQPESSPKVVPITWGESIPRRPRDLTADEMVAQAMARHENLAEAA